MTDDAASWTKPSPYSVAVIALVLGLIGWALYAGKLTFTESLLAAVLGLVTWITKGARPPVADTIGGPPPPPTTPMPPMRPLGEDTAPPSSDRPIARTRMRLPLYLMKLAGIAGLAFVLLAPGTTACTALQGQQVKSAVLSLADVACILLNAELMDADVARVCRLSDALLPDILNLLAAQRAATALAMQHRDAARAGAAPPCRTPATPATPATDAGTK